MTFRGYLGILVLQSRFKGANCNEENEDTILVSLVLYCNRNYQGYVSDSRIESFRNILEKMGDEAGNEFEVLVRRFTANFAFALNKYLEDARLRETRLELDRLLTIYRHYKNAPETKGLLLALYDQWLKAHTAAKHLGPIGLPTFMPTTGLGFAVMEELAKKEGKGWLGNIKDEHYRASNHLHEMVQKIDSDFYHRVSSIGRSLTAFYFSFDDRAYSFSFGEYGDEDTARREAEKAWTSAHAQAKNEFEDESSFPVFENLKLWRKYIIKLSRENKLYLDHEMSYELTFGISSRECAFRLKHFKRKVD